MNFDRLEAESAITEGFDPQETIAVKEGSGGFGFSACIYRISI
jgi:hypothetical protein